jgi:folate-binding protein YgfZ
MATQTVRIAPRARAYVAARGPAAATHLQSMLSNDVEALEIGGSCDALLLTAKARLVAPVRAWRRGADDFLLLTEPALGETLLAALVRTRFAAKVALELEEHRSTIVFGGEGGIPAPDYGEPAVELLDEAPAGEPLSADELELLRIEAGTPAWGKELDDRILPAEAGLDATHISFTKGCYPGQEPVARLHYRGHANRGLRQLELDAGALPAYDAELAHEGKAAGRVTSAAHRPDGTIAALGYVRTDVPQGAALRLGERPVRQVGDGKPPTDMEGFET